jgi:integrase
MSQQGSIHRKGDSWYLRYRDFFLVEGKLIRKQKVVFLAHYSDRYRRESDLADLVKDKLDRVRASEKCPQSASEFNEYAETVYLPSIARTKAASTAAAYEAYLSRYILPRTEGLALRDITIKTVSDLLESAATMHQLNTETVKKIRSVLSAIFTFAAQKGDVPARSKHDNPARTAMIAESATKPKPTACPTTDEVKLMLAYLSALPLEKAAVALIAFAGLRPGECRAICWQDWNRAESTMHVSKSRWHSIESAPKTERSIAPVAVSSELHTILVALWKSQGSPLTGRILSRAKGRPVNLDNMSKRAIAPALSRCAVCQQAEFAEHEGHAFKRDPKASVEWSGFYSLRRYFGTMMRSTSSSDTASKGLRNTKEVADAHYLNSKIAGVLPDVRRAVETASRLLA